MLQHSQCLKTICNISAIKKLHFNLINNRFSSKVKGDEPLKDLEEAPVSKLLSEATTFSEMSNKEWATTPYPVAPEQNPATDNPKKPKIDPSETSIILFPGQGTIKVGDVKQYMKFPRVKDLFEIANGILGYNLLKMCLEGPQKVLNRTEFNQPATVVLSLASLEKLQEERPKAIESCVAAAGLSVGELTALIFSGAMSYEEGLRLVAVRAAAMQSASELSPQGMLTCYCLPTAKPAKICEEAKKWAMDVGASDPVCRIAIYLYTQGKVFGGSKEALEYIEKNSRSLGLRKVDKLHVSGAFHTSLMEPALKSFHKAVDKTPIEQPNAEVYSNYSAKPFTNNLKTNRRYLLKQIVSPVKWEQIVHKLYERPQGTKFPRTFDMGSRGTMTTVLKMINAKAAERSYVY